MISLIVHDISITVDSRRKLALEDRRVVQEATSRTGAVGRDNVSREAVEDSDRRIYRRGRGIMRVATCAGLSSGLEEENPWLPLSRESRRCRIRRSCEGRVAVKARGDI